MRHGTAIAPSGPDRALIAAQLRCLALLHKVTRLHPQQSRRRGGFRGGFRKDSGWEGVVLLGISPEFFFFGGSVWLDMALVEMLLALFTRAICVLKVIYVKSPLWKKSPFVEPRCRISSPKRWLSLTREPTGGSLVRDAKKHGHAAH